MSALLELDITATRNWPQIKTDVDNQTNINMGKLSSAFYLAALYDGVKTGGKATLGLECFDSQL